MIINNISTDNPKLRAKALSNGQLSLSLEYYYGTKKVYDANLNKIVKRHDRQKETLHLYLWQEPDTVEKRRHNKEILGIAQQIRFDRSLQFLNDRKGFHIKLNQNINFYDYFKNYLDNYTKKDVKMIKMALARFKDFIQSEPEYKPYIFNITPDQLNRDMMKNFVEYLQKRSKGEGAKSCFQRFKKVINHMVEHDILTKSPCNGITVRSDGQYLRKDVLSEDDISKLISFNDPNQNKEIRKAFIFCLFTGLRFCDVKDLTYANIDYSNKFLKFDQSKTKGLSSASGVFVPLKDEILELVGTPAKWEDRNRLIFKLPCYATCSKSVNKWVKKAGIDKHITWHCARHSFAVNLLNRGNNIKTVASLLGHSGLKHTEKYTRAVDSLKISAVNSLQGFKTTGSPMVS